MPYHHKKVTVTICNNARRIYKVIAGSQVALLIVERYQPTIIQEVPRAMSFHTEIPKVTIRNDRVGNSSAPYNLRNRSVPDGEIQRITVGNDHYNMRH